MPTDDVAPTVLFNDVGIGKWIYTGGERLTAIIPTFELHVNNPLSHRGQTDPQRRRDSVDLTGGVNSVLGDRASLGTAIATPVTGPRLFDVEAMMSLNWWF